MRIYGSMNRFDPLASTVDRIILDDRLEFHQDRIDAAGVGKLQKKQSTFSNNKHQVLIVGCHYSVDLNSEHLNRELLEVRYSDHPLYRCLVPIT